MTYHDAMTRRQFTGVAASGLAGTLLTRAVPPMFTQPDTAQLTWPGYGAAIVIDNLATPGPFNVPNGFAHPFTPLMVANARASGITAANVTLSGGGTLGAEAFEEALQNIAFLENEFDRHPHRARRAHCW